MNKVLTKIDLADKVWEKTGIPRVVISDIMSELFEEITKNLESGTDVKLSSFGTFKTRNKPERMGRNPKTGESAVISARTVVSFSPSNTLKEKVELNNTDEKS